LSAGDDDRDDLAGVGVGDVVEQRPAEQVVRRGAGVFQRGDRVAPGLGRSDRAGQADLADVVDDRAHLPGPAAGRLELAEVGLPDAVAPPRRLDERLAASLRELAALAGDTARRLQQPAPAQGALDRRLGALDAVEGHQRVQLAMSPSRPAQGVVDGQILDRVADGRRPQTLLDVTFSR
jgi:hypothetical protein